MLWLPRHSLITPQSDLLRDPGLVDWENPVADHPLNRGCILWAKAIPNRRGWGSTTWKFLIGGNGTLVNTLPASDWVDGLRPPQGFGSLNFQGSGHVTLNQISLPTNVSFAAWMNTDSINADYDRVIGASDSGATVYWGFGRHDQDVFLEEQSSGGNVRIWETTNNPLSIGTWYHIAAAQLGVGTPVLYVNGVALSVTTTSSSGTVVKPITQPTAIGRPGNSGFPTIWDGRLDDIRVYNRAISADDVRALMFSPHVLNRTGRVHYRAQQASTVTPSPVSAAFSVPALTTRVISSASPVSALFAAPVVATELIQGLSPVPAVFGTPAPATQLRHSATPTGATFSVPVAAASSRVIATPLVATFSVPVVTTSSRVIATPLVATFSVPAATTGVVQSVPPLTAAFSAVTPSTKFVYAPSPLVLTWSVRAIFEPALIGARAVLGYHVAGPRRSTSHVAGARKSQAA